MNGQEANRPITDDTMSEAKLQQRESRSNFAAPIYFCRSINKNKQKAKMDKPQWLGRKRNLGSL